jgi:methyltransferase (TIGR00027 family)
MSQFGNQDTFMAETAQRKRTDSDFVSFTARMMAAMRAQETQSHDRLFNDPFAAQLAGTEAFAIVEHRLTPQDKAYVAVRTRFFDDFLLTAVAKLEAPQVVILASGMDARAFRLPWLLGTQVYELDCQEVLESKAVVLKDVPPTCEHYLLAADLRQPWQHLLLGTGYRDNIASVWLLEGLLMYL